MHGIEGALASVDHVHPFHRPPVLALHLSQHPGCPLPIDRVLSHGGSSTLDAVDSSTAEATLQKQRKNLKPQAQASPELRGRDRFLFSLGAFDGRLAEARHELQQLKLANAASWEAYQRSVQSAEGVLIEEFRSRVGAAPRSVRCPSEEAAATESDE
jgi:hypothetical protein